jgi:hypothetical protein
VTVPARAPTVRRLVGIVALVALVASACAASTACGSFDSEEQPAGDAGNDVTAADVTPETPSDGDAAPQRACAAFDASDAAFCADFDGVDWMEGWDSPGAQVIGGSLDRDPDGYSPPAAFRSTTAGNQAGPSAAPLSLTFPATQGKSARARFMLRVPPSHPGTYAHFCAVRFGGKFVQFVLGQQGASVVVKEQSLLADAGPGVTYPVPAAVLDDGAWKSVDLRVDVPGQLTLSLDGKVVLNTKVTVADAGLPMVVFYFGLWSEAAAASWTASYDDVRLDVQ